jgi:hypothetical protein
MSSLWPITHENCCNNLYKKAGNEGVSCSEMNLSSDSDDDASHTDSNHEQHHLSCGMILPKRRRIGRFRQKHEPVDSRASRPTTFKKSRLEQARRNRCHVGSQNVLPLLSIPEALVAPRPLIPDPARDQKAAVESKKNHKASESSETSSSSTTIQDMPVDGTGPAHQAESTTSFPRLLRRFPNCHIEISCQEYTMAQALELSSNPHCVIEAVDPFRVIHTNAALFAFLSSTLPLPTQPSAPFVNLTLTEDEAAHLMNVLFGAFHPQRDYTTITLYPMCSSSLRNHPRYYFLEIVHSSNMANGTSRDVVHLWKEENGLARQIVG